MQTIGDGGEGADPVGRVESELSPDDIFKTLSNRRRRHVLHYLRHIDGTVTIRDLSEQLAAWENGTTTSEVVPGERKRLYTALHQTHLPKMDALGVVTYDRNRGTVRMNDSLREFDAYLDAMSSEGRAWGPVYLAVSCALGLLAAAGAAGLPPLASLGGYGYALVTAAVIAGLAAGETIQRYRQPAAEPDRPPAAVGGTAGNRTTDD